MFASVKFGGRYPHPQTVRGPPPSQRIVLARMILSGAIVVCLFVTFRMALYLDRQKLPDVLDYNKLKVIQPQRSDDPNVYKGRGGRSWRKSPAIYLDGKQNADVINAQNDDVINAVNSVNLTISDSDSIDFSPIPCTKETVCYLFQKFLKTWPMDTPKAVIYTLTRATGRGEQLKKMIASLYKNFNDRYKYPLIIFYHGQFNANEIQYFLSGAPGDAQIFFQKVSMPPPPVLPAPNKNGCNSDAMMRHECRFHAGMVYTHPILRGVDYVWRLNDDAELLPPAIDYDVFNFMQKFHLSYGYIDRGIGTQECATSVLDVVNAYMKQNHIRPSYLHRTGNKTIFRTSFEISKPMIWQSKAYRHFLGYVDRIGGIFRHGWCDDVIKSLALAMLSPAKEIHQFTDIAFSQGGFTAPGKGTRMVLRLLSESFIREHFLLDE